MLLEPNVDRGAVETGARNVGEVCDLTSIEVFVRPYPIAIDVDSRLVVSDQIVFRYAFDTGQPEVICRRRGRRRWTRPDATELVEGTLLPRQDILLSGELIQKTQTLFRWRACDQQFFGLCSSRGNPGSHRRRFDTTAEPENDPY